MRKNEFLSLAEKHKLVAVLRGNSDEVYAAAERLASEGVKLLEITFTVREAPEILKSLCAKYKNTDVIVGAGTVLDAETARIALLSGAQFVVSPALCTDVIKLCNRYSVAVVPGIATASELLTALEYGVDLVKLFPADLKLLSALKGPFPNARFMVTGGVDEKNLSDWFKAGASAVGAGSALTAPGADVRKWLDIVNAFR
ncbi:MAG: bifunctional 4-hydroxy-2-oxoglutarate aldolase/2-dehydro-3-deoxy-phosphogluconate aldolase [Clostridiales bacterium]|jgi:2-dehydro-3-deoxyphosphogluconate aldolase/(4S)-4-hydroxy-2-oxoglutarate aldolase|nr:bifunctional 4-hydroxy-2-oxoglutarate aldolase/2-dehydro-3-deoxy-phosphogluconate aldolase [Clostridiales bacterium]